MFRIIKEEYLNEETIAAGLLALFAIGIWALVLWPAHAEPQPASIYAALQAQRNTCQDQAALAAAANSEEVVALKAQLAALKKDFGVE